MPKSKRAQLRVCSICNKSGHNRSTCADKFLSSEKETSPLSPSHTGLNFYIHHVSDATRRSPHILDLKKTRDNLLEQIIPSSPTKNNSTYHSYHEQITIPAAPLETENQFTHRVSDLIFEPNDDVADSTPIPPTPLLPPKPTKVRTPKKHTDYAAVFHRMILVAKKSISDLTHRIAHFLPWKKLAFATAALTLVLIAPFQADSYYQNVRLTTDKISSDGRAGFMSLQESTTAFLHADLNSAQDSLNTALNKFAGAVDTMQTEHRWLQKMVAAIPIVNNEIISREQLIIAGQKIALGNTYLVKGLAESQSQNSNTLTDRLDLLVKHLDAALPNYQSALNNLGAIKSDVLPLEYQAPFNDFKILFTAILNDLQNLSELGKTIKEVFGGEGLRRYLLVFQNPNELRPTGGFIGSFAVMDVRDGSIVNMSIPAGGSYDLKGQLNERLEPPAPMLLLGNNKWQFQDGNWYPDFPASAEKLMWFYRKSRNVTVDGVIAINASVLERLLGIIGPITDEKRGLTLSADSALATIQTEVESTSTRATKKPKQIISDLAPQFLENFKNIKPENILPILTNLQEALTQKEIQAYFTDRKTEATVKEYGWSGQITDTNSEQDYLMVVNTNIGGQKSDAHVAQTVSHQAVINDDGSITDTVIITRSHSGTTAEQMYGATNVDYLRIYVPAGSELLTASGFTWPDESRFHAPDQWAKKDAGLAQIEKEISIDNRSGTRITREFGKTAFGNWVITEPGQTTQAHFVYRLPFKAKIYTAESPGADWKNMFLGNDIKTALRYQLIAQNQSGANSTFESQIILPPGWQPIWQDGPSLKSAANGLAIENMKWTKDSIWSLLAQTTN